MTNDRSRKKEIRERMAQTGEAYSVAARHIDTAVIFNAPADAFNAGYYRDKKPSPAPLQLKDWTLPYYELVTSGWEGDTELLHEMGETYRELDEKGNYFCFNHYLVKFIRNWFLSQTFMSTAPKFLERLEDVNKSIDWDLVHAKEMNLSTHHGIKKIEEVLWPELRQGERAVFVRRLIECIRNLPSVEEANTIDIIYNQYIAKPPVKRQNISVGDKVKFSDDRLYWDARAVTENFVILTRKAAFSKKGSGDIVYTIIDWAHGARGAHNSYGYGTTTDEDIQALSEALEASLSTPLNRSILPYGEIHLGRNQVALHIQSISSPKPVKAKV